MPKSVSVTVDAPIMVVALFSLFVLKMIVIPMLLSVSFITSSNTGVVVKL
jgi:hypothetical protein